MKIKCRSLDGRQDESGEMDIKTKGVKIFRVLELLKEKVVPGITTDDLDRMAEEAIRARGAVPAFKGYRNYPKTLCASVNEQVVHGIPSKRKLKPFC